MRSTRVRAARLDPVGRVRMPRRATTLRAALVAALLLTAAGLVYSGGGRADGAPSPVDQPAPASTPAWPVEVTPEFAGARQPIPDGMVGLPVPLAEPAALAVLRPGDRVDLLTVPAAGGDPAPLAAGARVLAVDRAGGSVLLSLTEGQAQAVLATPAESRYAVVVRP